MKIADLKEAWQAGPEVLKADKKVLERGSELHHRSFVRDACGFAPDGPGAPDLPRMGNPVRRGFSDAEIRQIIGGRKNNFTGEK